MDGYMLKALLMIALFGVLEVALDFPTLRPIKVRAKTRQRKN